MHRNVQNIKITTNKFRGNSSGVKCKYVSKIDNFRKENTCTRTPLIGYEQLEKQPTIKNLIKRVRTHLIESQPFYNFNP